jgi:polyribonucleotide nucleotidyltransferase
MSRKFAFEEFGLEVEIGKVAQQANGAVWVRQGGTVLLAAATQAVSKDFPGFLPLSVDYREQYSAAGKIPGGYYKREGKSSDREVLTGRLVDRAVRPLFPANFFNQVQVIATVYSVDKEHAPHNTLALLAGSLALGVSDIPFMGPVGVVEIGRVEGAWVINPLYSQSLVSDVRLVIAGTREGICMVEGSGREISEQDMVDVLFFAHEKIKELVAWQESIIQAVGKAKMAIDDVYQWDMWTDRVGQFLTDDLVAGAYIADKATRNRYLDGVRQRFVEQYTTELEQGKVPVSVITYIMDTVIKERLTEEAFEKNSRIDGRGFDQIRPITSEVGLLPFTHGSALFTRGQTQALASVTLGSGDDEQRIESLMTSEKTSGTFMLHYNFLSFSTGEVKPSRAPSRREVGHGYLAATSFSAMLPSSEVFPYTIRVVVDILESDGSSSMATTCASTMALMHAGVPIKKMVSGIAMGLLKSCKKDSFIVLSDIGSIEDSFGLMDFKVTGTSDGICAIQMDIKYKGGLSRAVFERALEQARVGRLHILNEMSKVITAPNEMLSDLVPRVETMRISVDKIGAVIGSGGKTIREITETTNTKIDIEPDGLVKVFGVPGEDLKKAVLWIRTLSGQIEPGTVYEGKVRRVADFGLFVEIVPGLDGLVHVSNIPKDVQRVFGRTYAVNQVVTVKVLDYDATNGRISLKIIDSKNQPA